MIIMMTLIIIIIILTQYYLDFDETSGIWEFKDKRKQ